MNGQNDEASQNNHTGNVITVEIGREQTVRVVRDIAFVKRLAPFHTVRGPISNIRFERLDDSFGRDALPIKPNHELWLLRVGIHALDPFPDLQRNFLADQERPCWSFVVDSLCAEWVKIGIIHDE